MTRNPKVPNCGFFGRIHRYGFAGPMGESVGCGKYIPEDYIFDLNADGHRFANFNPKYTHIGCASWPGSMAITLVYAKNWKSRSLSEEDDVKDPTVYPPPRVKTRELLAWKGWNHGTPTPYTSTSQKGEVL